MFLHSKRIICVLSQRNANGASNTVKNLNHNEMKTTYFFINLFLLAFLISLNGCFSSSQTMKLNSIELTNQLHPGMSYSEVVELLGKPKTSRTSGNNYIVRWNLQQMWKGYIPYDMVFKADDKTLI